jgi:hypothetical protein
MGRLLVGVVRERRVQRAAVHANAGRGARRPLAHNLSLRRLNLSWRRASARREGYSSSAAK